MNSSTTYALRRRSVAHERDGLYDLIKQQRNELQRAHLNMLDANQTLTIATAKARDLVYNANATALAANVNARRFRTLAETSLSLVWQLTPMGASNSKPIAGIALPATS